MKKEIMFVLAVGMLASALICAGALMNPTPTTATNTASALGGFAPLILFVILLVLALHKKKDSSEK